MSLLTYNGITLQLMRTLSFEMFNERDPSGTDVLWNTYRIRAIGIPTTNDTLTTPSAQTIAAIKESLNTPRCAISYQMNDGTTVFSTTGLDAQLGPEAVNPAVVRQVTSDAIFVEVDYKVRLRDCATGNPDPVVSLRWSQTESFNELWTSKLTTDGRLVVRSDLRQSADSFRALCTPTVERDYQRTEASYTLSPSGTELAFRFVDEEHDRLPPFPAVKASGRFTVQVQKSLKRTAQADVSLTGQYGTSRKDLMVVAIRMAYSKLVAEGVQYTMGGSFSEDLMEPQVGVSLQGFLKTTGTGIVSAFAGLVGRVAGVVRREGIHVANPGPRPPGVFPSVGKPPAGVSDDGADGIAPPTRKRIFGLLVAAFRDPCAAVSVNAVDVDLRTDRGDNSAELRARFGGPGGGPVGGGGGGGKGGGAAATLSVAELPTAGEPVIVDAAPYDHYHCTTGYSYSTGKKQLPGTGTGQQGDVSSIVTVHGGAMQMVVSWAAVRSGAPPVLPNFQLASQNLEPLDGAITVEHLDVTGGGDAPVYAVGGWYSYAVLDPKAANIGAAVPPFLSDTVGQGANLAGGFYAEDILWQFQGTGANPFIGQGTTGQEPDANIARQMQGGGGGGGGFSLDLPPPGGLGTDGGSGTGLLGGPTLGN